MNPNTTIGSLRLFHVYMLVTALERMGVQRHNSCTVLGLPCQPSRMESDIEISLDYYLQLCQQLIAHFDDPLLFLKMGQHIYPEDLGRFGQLLKHSGNLQHTLQSICQYEVLHPPLQNRFHFDKKTSVYFFDTGSLDCQELSPLINFRISCMVNVLRHISKHSDEQPIYTIGIAHHNVCPERYSGILDVPVTAHEYHCINFHSQALKQPLPETCKTRYKQYLSLVSPRASNGPHTWKVSEYIREYLESSISTESAANYFGISASSLKRYLREEKTSFKTLHDQIRFDAARSMLGTDNVSIKAVALSLGYSDSSSFCKSFTRWSGMSPGQYKNSLSNEYLDS